MKHVVIVTTSFPMASDGSEAAGSFVFDFTQKLSENYRVTVVAPGQGVASDIFNPNCNIIRYKTGQRPLSQLRLSNPQDWFKIVQVIYSGLKTLDKVVSSEKIDHILALWVLPCGYWAKYIGNKYSVPYSTWALGSDIWSLGKIPFVRQVLKRVLKDSRVNYADGYQLKESVESFSGRPCHFLPSTRKLIVPHSKKLSEKPPYKLAFLGRWHHNKGIDILLNSLHLLSVEDWQKISEVRIFGGGPLEALVHSHVKSLQDSGCPIVVGGYLNKTQAVDLLLWADYLLIPSRVESIPVVFSDSMKCLCPVISSPVGDLPRLVRAHGLGELAKSVDPKSFADSIVTALYKCPKEYEDNMKKISKQFSLDHVIDRLCLDSV